MNVVSVIGMGLSPQDLTARHLELIGRAGVLVGGKRHLAWFKDTPAIKREITRDLSGLIRYVKQQHRHKAVVVLASGDPLFFGIGARLIDALGAEHVTVYPNISTVAAAFARLKLPWDAVRVVSLHGRQEITKVFNALKQNDLVAVYTDPKHHPGWLAERLLEKGYRDVDLCVLEQLGSQMERMGWYDLDRAVDMKFGEPNLTVLRRREQRNVRRTLFLGSPENWFEHEGGLITKAEIRAVTLSKLRLKSDHIFWDLGAGSGSISIEAALFIRRGKIFAVEQNTDRVAHIERNKKRFRLRNVSVIQAVLPGGLETLPEPNRIFIGGGGRHLAAIIETACRHLKADGIIVINTVIIEHLDTAMKTLRALDFKTDMVQIQVHRSHQMPHGERLEAENPVWIISGERECHES